MDITTALIIVIIFLLALVIVLLENEKECRDIIREQEDIIGDYEKLIYEKEGAE